MKINSICVKNFGSYEGQLLFDFNNPDSDKNIVIIGGKNGAGKTTLFTAIRLCIYGYRSYGYQSMNSFYKKNIIKLINNNAKFNRPANAAVTLHVTINNGHENDEYDIARSWVLDYDNSVEETIIVIKNGVGLGAEAIADFETFMMQLIPPELFNLYFFDGEKIADFFLDEGNSTHLKDAFLTLCGYDTFDIMRKNFKRNCRSDNYTISAVSKNYFRAKETVDSLQFRIKEDNQAMETASLELEKLDSLLLSLTDSYKKSGGVTQDEWDGWFEKLKEEERKREADNAFLKRTANDVLPLLLLRNQLQQIQLQVEQEEQLAAIHNLSALLTDAQHIFQLVNNLQQQEVDVDSRQLSAAINQFSQQLMPADPVIPILALSPDEKSVVSYHIKNILKFKERNIKNAVNRIKKSTRNSAAIRMSLDTCNVDSVQSYLKQTDVLSKKKVEALDSQRAAQHLLIVHTEELQIAQAALEKAKKEYELELKKGSINDLSVRAIVFLDKLQERLYSVQIEKVEQSFKDEIKTLMRKATLITNIKIDLNFNIHVFRTQRFTVEELKEFKKCSKLKLGNLVGERAAEMILSLNEKNLEPIELEVELDKTAMSSGEKQIFIMSLYKALMKLCSHEVPFVIDTPFARIDTEHRENITRHFFQGLKGQVFILSTNEEIDAHHMSILEPNVQAIYTLENNDKATSIRENSFFEEVI